MAGREIDLDLGTGSELAANTDGTASVFDDLFDRRQSKSGSVALAFGTEKGLEDFRLHGLGHARASVANQDLGGDSEEGFHIGFHWGTAVEQRVVVDEGKVLALLVGELWGTGDRQAGALVINGS